MAEEQLTCKVCYVREVKVAFLPCGHLCCCQRCCRKLSGCPICRARVTRCVWIRLSPDSKIGVDTPVIDMTETQLNEQILCKKCLKNKAEIAFYPCGHLYCCLECSHKFNINLLLCRLCKRTAVRLPRRIFLS